MFRAMCVFLIVFSGCVSKRYRMHETSSHNSKRPSQNTSTERQAEIVEDINRGENSPLNGRAPKGGFLTAASCSFVAETKLGQLPTCIEVRSRDKLVIADHKRTCLSRGFESSHRSKFSADVCKSVATHMCSQTVKSKGKQWSELRYYELKSPTSTQIARLKRDCEERDGKLAALGYENSWR